MLKVFSIIVISMFAKFDLNAYQFGYWLRLIDASRCCAKADADTQLAIFNSPASKKQLPIFARKRVALLGENTDYNGFDTQCHISRCTQPENSCIPVKGQPQLHALGDHRCRSRFGRNPDRVSHGLSFRWQMKDRHPVPSGLGDCVVTYKDN